MAKMDPVTNPQPSPNQSVKRPTASENKSLPSNGPNFTRGNSNKGPPHPNNPYRS